MRQIDGKYQTSGDITKLDGTPVPADEPLVLFRAKDKLVPAMLEHYAGLCEQAGSPPEQIQGIRHRLEAVKQWQAANANKVDVPD
jgi:hypothetical protein